MNTIEFLREQLKAKIQNKKDLIKEIEELRVKYKDYQIINDIVVSKEFQEITLLIEKGKYSEFIERHIGLARYLERYKSDSPVFEEADPYNEIVEDIENRKNMIELPSWLGGITLCKGLFTALAAPSGHGKTRYCINIVYELYKQGLTIDFFNIEPSPAEIYYQLLQTKIYKESNKVYSFDTVVKAAASDIQKYGREASVLKSINDMKKKIRVYKYSDNNATPNSLIYTHKVKGEMEGYADVCIIDHFHVLKSDQDLRGKMRSDINEDISKDLRAGIKSTKAAWVITGHLNQEEIKSKDKFDVSGWKHTASVPADAATYLKLFRRIEDNRMTENIDLYVVKNRYGAVGKKELRIVPECGVFIS